MRNEQSALLLKIKTQSLEDYNRKLGDIKLEWDKINQYKLDLQKTDLRVQGLFDKNTNIAKDLSEREEAIKLREDDISKQLTDFHQKQNEDMAGIQTK